MSFAYLPLYTGDYLRDTRHLTPLKHGVFLLLLMHCWDQKGPVPLDEQEAAGVANCRSADEIDSLRYVLERFFTRMEDGWYNHRMQVEIERAENISRERSDAGRKGYQAKAKQLLSKSQASASTPTPTPIPSPGKDKDQHPSDACAPDGAPRPPVEEIVNLWNQIVAAAGGKKALNVSAERRKRICRRWREVGPDSVAEGLFWFEAYFRENISKSKFATGKQPGRDGRVFRIGIDSALGSEQTMDQILEGKYT